MVVPSFYPIQEKAVSEFGARLDTGAGPLAYDDRTLYRGSLCKNNADRPSFLLRPWRRIHPRSPRRATP